MASATAQGCRAAGDMPLFGNDVCVSPLVYAILLITAVSVSGIALIALFICLVCICCRRSCRAADDDDSSSTTGLLPGRSNDKKLSTVLTRALDDVSEQDSEEAYDSRHLITPAPYASTSNPFTNIIPIPNLPVGWPPRPRRPVRQSSASSSSSRRPPSSHRSDFITERF